MAAPTVVKDVAPAIFVKEYAAYLRSTNKVELPAWVDLVKTATYKELAPYDADWYYVRAASMARKIYLRQGLGVGGFRKMYGGAAGRNTTCPAHFKKCSGSIIRNILQQLEKIGIVEKMEDGGRMITDQGRRDLDRIASRALQIV